MFKKEFWEATAERFVKTLAQATGAILLANGTGLIDTDWIGVLSTGGMAALLSVLTSVGSSALPNGTGPAAFGPEELKSES